jgi:hypothetical protein
MQMNSRIAAVTVFILFGSGIGCLSVLAAEKPPEAPTILDAHQYVESVVLNNGVAALYTLSRDGEILGYVNFPVRKYKGVACNSAITLSSGAKIEFNWALVSEAQANDGQLGMWRNQNVIYEYFHMLTIEGGIVAIPSNNIPKLILAVNNEVSRNRLLKAINLLSSTCRGKSKFD